MKFKRCIPILLLAGTLLAAGCGGGGTALGSSDNSFGNIIDLGPSQFTGTQRALAMDRVSKKYEDFMAVDPSTAMGRLASFVKTQPEFSSASVKTNTLICTFKDKRVFLFLDNFGEDVLGNRSSGSGMRDVEGIDSMAPAQAIPGSRKVLLMQSSVEDTQGHTNTLNDINTMFLKRKFAVTKSTNISVNGLKTLGKDLAVFYIHTHGAMYWWNNDTELRDYSLMTDTLVNDQNEAMFADDIRRGRLTYTRPRSIRGQEDYKGRYCVTSGFIRQYVTMNKGLVYINACDGGSIGATAMREAFMFNGAGAYVGYNGKTTAYGYVPAAYFFDRMLGANVVEKVSPNNRVFTLSEVWAKMGKKQQHGTSYLQDPQNRIPLMKWENGLKLLTPNIKSLEFLEKDSVAIVTDVPPTEPDLKVFIAGVLYPHIVQNGKIVVRLKPTTQGDVVLDVNGHISNERPIISWRGPVKYEMWIGASPAKLTVNYNLHLRADGYELRNEVDGEVSNGKVPFIAATDSTASYQFSGTAGNATWSGSGPLAYGFPASSATPFSCTGLVFAKDMNMRIQPTFFTCTATVTGPGGSFQQAYPPQAALWEFWDQPFKHGWEIISHGWIMRLDTDLSIQAKTYEGRASGQLLYRISWPRIAGTPVYDKETER